MRVEPVGPVPCDLMIVEGAPNYESIMAREFFSGKGGSELWAGMERFCGLTRDQFYMTALIKYALPKNREPKPEEVSSAIPELIDELEVVRPKLIITAGAISTKALLGNVKLSDVHGIPHRVEICGNEYVVLPMYHPSSGLGNKGFLSVVAYDLGCISARLKGKFAPWAPASRPWAVEWLTRPGIRSCDRCKAGAVVAIDSEGWPDAPKLFSFTADGDHAFVIRASDAEQLTWLKQWIANKTLVLHGGIYDMGVYRAADVHFERFHDTQVLAYHEMIRTGCGVLEAESQNLGTLAYRECGMVLKELSDLPGVDFDTQTIPYSDEVMHYAGEDAIATYRLFKRYEQRGLTNTRPYQIDMGQVPIVENMIATGLPFDVDATFNFYGDILGKLEDTTTELRAKAARYGNRDFNPGSHPQVREIVTRKIGLRIRKRTKGGKASTNEKALAEHQDHPFVKGIQTFRELQKLKGTYLEPLLEELS